MLKRNGIKCSQEEADSIKISQRGQRPETHAKYKEAIAACDSMEYIECNVSQIAREFGLDGTNLARQLRTHYPDVLEFRERERQRLGLARAFLHNAPLMLLDEPTSNLDSLNEAVILRSLKEEGRDKTVVLVSHRASTMRIAGRVYSVEHGRMS